MFAACRVERQAHKRQLYHSVFRLVARLLVPEILVVELLSVELLGEFRVRSHALDPTIFSDRTRVVACRGPRWPSLPPRAHEWRRRAICKIWTSILFLCATRCPRDPRTHGSLRGLQRTQSACPKCERADIEVLPPTILAASRSGSGAAPATTWSQRRDRTDQGAQLITNRIQSTRMHLFTPALGRRRGLHRGHTLRPRAGRSQLRICKYEGSVVVGPDGNGWVAARFPTTGGGTTSPTISTSDGCGEESGFERDQLCPPPVKALAVNAERRGRLPGSLALHNRTQ